MSYSGRGRSLRVDALAQRHRVQLGVFAAFSSLKLVIRNGRSRRGRVLRPRRSASRSGTRVQHRLVLDPTGGLAGLLDDDVNRPALCPAGLLAEFFEHLLKPLDLFVGLFEMVLEARDKIPIGRLVSIIFGRALEDLLLRVVDVPENRTSRSSIDFISLVKILGVAMFQLFNISR
jgi:hypothetical protein